MVHAIVIQFRRGKRTVTPKHFLIEIEGSDSRDLSERSAARRHGLRRRGSERGIFRRAGLRRHGAGSRVSGRHSPRADVLFAVRQPRG